MESCLFVKKSVEESIISTGYSCCFDIYRKREEEEGEERKRGRKVGRSLALEMEKE